ncbi:phosphoinositide phospholipase C 6-like [Cornus florida]|uniref:phosphoinositide phospholipase C 6-like n=1 Tax=Cornus florida TaxID=4283 RepID=UPI002897AF44|nr:phosphoinositide phospholipase C 6-like [Cornus florida]
MEGFKVFGFNRKFKITEVEPPPDVKAAFMKYTDKGSHMSVYQLHQFLVEYQGEEVCTLSEAERVIQQVHHLRKTSPSKKKDTRKDTSSSKSKDTPKGLTLDDFFHFLSSDELNGPVTTQVHHDMTAPVQHYFIYTGHNSYLTGNQLSSDSSDLPIIQALHRGVRVIELDLWPNSAKDDIHVLHGRTLTTPVSLIKCLKSIKEHAFDQSPYPVIITLEDHLTPDLQAKVAEMAIQTFGKMLYYPELGCSEEFPSPEALKHRIILSTKPPKEYLESKNPKDLGNTSTLHRRDSSEEEARRESLDLKAELEDSNQFDDESDIYDRKSFQAGAPQYKHLIAIHAGKPKDGLKGALKIEIGKIRRLSLSEQALEKAAASFGTDLLRFTQKNILRIYPKGTRVTSSNYNPLTAWIHGAQMVAFNMQGRGKSLWLMHGMFRANGGCGYVKKPDFLMNTGPNDDILFDPKAALPVKETLKVRVFMGDGWRLDFSQTHFDTFSPPDFYTKVHLRGVPADSAKKKTRVISDDWSPVWDEEFTFPLRVPELALLQIVVQEYDSTDKDDFGGQTCLPVAELRPGIRAVALHDEKGMKYKSVKLLMQFQFV